MGTVFVFVIGSFSLCSSLSSTVPHAGLMLSGHLENEHADSFADSWSLTPFCGLGSIYMHSWVAGSGVGFCTDLLTRLHTGDTID